LPRPHRSLRPRPRREGDKKEAAAPKPKPEPKKKEADAEEEDDGVDREEKKKSNLDSLPRSKLDLEEWKRKYSNESTREVAMPWLWENFDAEGYSFWYSDYKFNAECTKLFMTANLLGGFVQRLDKLRKYGFGSLIIFGEEPALQVAGVWLFRGPDVPQEMQEVDDYPNYTWKKLDHKDEKDRKLIEDYFAWDGEFGGSRPALAQGKAFK